MITPGEVYMADHHSGPHPVIVVSRESLNGGNYVLCVLCTSARYDRRRHFPNSVVFHAGEFGFTKNCVAQCESVLLLEKSQLRLDEGPLGIVDDERRREIIRAIGYVIEGECEPE